jgi:IPT/TIG domain
MDKDIIRLATEVQAVSRNYADVLKSIQWYLDLHLGPRVDGFAPIGGFPGSVITLHGVRFSPEPARNQVTVGGVPAFVLAASPDELTVIVGRGTRSGPVQVTVDAHAAIASVDFTVLPRPRAGAFEDGPPRFFAGAGNPPTAGLDAHGRVRALVAICYANDRVPANAATLRTDVETRFNPAHDFYDQVSYGVTNLDLDYTDAIALSGAYDDYYDASISNIGDLDRICAEAAQGAVDQGVNLDDYDFMVVTLFLNGGFIRAWGGWSLSNFSYDDGTTNISISTSHPLMMIAIGDNADWGRVAHEVGHGLVDAGAVLGEDVYSSDLVDGSVATAQNFELMGNHDTHPCFSGHFMRQLDYYASTNILDLVWDRNPFDNTYTLVAHGITQNTSSARRHLIRIRVGDGVFYYIEVRQQMAAGAASFDTAIPVPGGSTGGVIVTKVFTDQVNVNQELRFITLLHDPETQSTGAVIEDPARALRITVGTVVATSPLAMNVRVEWAQTIGDNPAGTFDLRLTQTSVPWVSDDIWVDRQPWGVTNETDGDGHIVATREKPRPGEINRLYGQVFNSGPDDTTNVKLTFYAITPPGVGDNGAWAPISTRTLATVNHSTAASDYVNWTPTVGQHTCLKVYASAQFGEVTVGNNQAQENVFYFAPPASSPPEPVRMKVAIRNPRDEDAVIPVHIHGVPHGYAVQLPHAWYCLPPKGERTVEFVILPFFDIEAYEGKAVVPLGIAGASAEPVNHGKNRRGKLEYRTATIDLRGYVPRAYADSLPTTGLPASTHRTIGGLRAAVTPKRRIDIWNEKDENRNQHAIAVRGGIRPALLKQRIELVVTEASGERHIATTYTNDKGEFSFYLDRMPSEEQRQAWDTARARPLKGVYKAQARAIDATDAADATAPALYFQFGARAAASYSYEVLSHATTRKAEPALEGVISASSKAAHEDERRPNGKKKDVTSPKLEKDAGA